MRILVTGAGAIGGYFGGRLLEAGRDVTFLVRPQRAAILAEKGLRIRSRFGDVDIAVHPTVTAENLHEPFDLILLSTKAYDLDDAIESFAPAVSERTAILPTLNGIRHLDVLRERFGDAAVLGGQCLISAVLDESGAVVHLNDTHEISFGELDGSKSQRVEHILSTFATARVEARLSEEILEEMWEKCVFIATAAGITSLMRAAVGDIVEAGGVDFVDTLLAECSAVATKESYAPRAASIERARKMLTMPGSTLTASMLKDIERGARIEADHIHGDLIRRAGKHGIPTPFLRVVYTHLKAYEARRAREASAKDAASYLVEARK
jgi:2-dehydropantoate 2-reductase